MRHLRNPFVQVGLWTFAITAVVGAVVWTLPWEPEQASSQAGPIDTLYDVLALVSAFVLALVTSIVIVAVVHFRKRSPDDLRDGEPIHGNTRLEVIWTTIPALLMVGTAVYSGLVLADIEESKADTRTVNVTGEQFAWTFDYQQEKVRAGELHLVEDTPYLFKLDAKDVIHSFWVPEFRMKRDAVPGMTTTVRVTPTRKGRYTLACTELCGLGHSTMRATVVVEDQAGFDIWAQRLKSGEEPPPGGVVSPKMAAVASAANRGTLHQLMAPGWIRAAWMTLAGAAFAFALVVGGRAVQGFDPVIATDPIVTVILLAAPLAFLVGIGGFDYWGRWMIGRPTQPEDHSDHGARSWKDYFRVNTDHKVIGIQYVVTALFFMFVAGALAEVVRAELAQPGQQVVDPNTYNGLFSVHASLMIFLVVIPIFAGLANYVLPLMIGAPDMAFPRLNALSYWLLPVAGVMMMSSFLVPESGAFNTGWTAYAPLSDNAPLGQNMFTIGVQFAGTSSIMTALNFIVTIITMRAPGMTFWRMPLLVWANFTTSLLVVIATPFVAGSQFLVLIDRALHANFFDASQGGDVIAYQHIFWFYSHPAVYIMMLPGFGIISEIISTKARKPIFGYRLMALSLMAILVLGFTVWAHHMFVSGMWNWLRVPMMITTMLIAVPTGIKIFSWLATLWKGVLELSTPMLFALGFIIMFTLGGISGIMLSAIPVDIHTSDSYFVVAHIHYVLFGGSMFTIFAGIYYWFPKMTGRMYDETLGKIHFWMTFVGFNVTFGPMHWLGLEGMPRRVADYADKFAAWNLVSTIGAFLMGAAMLVFLYNFVASWASGPRAPGNPWRARTLEWQVSSPPPIFNFDEIPQVVGGPYEYGVPGSVHAVLNGDRKQVPVGAESDPGHTAHAPNGNGNGNGAGPESRRE